MKISPRRPLFSASKAAFLILSFTLGLPSCTTASDTPPPSSWSNISKAGLFTVTLGLQEGKPLVNVMQNWVLTIEDKKGAAVDSAQLLLDGGMPGHGHGLPTSPQITQYLGDGQYLIEGLRLNMPGKWALLIGIEFNSQRDLASFEFTVDY